MDAVPGLGPGDGRVRGGEVVRVSRPCYDKRRRCPGWAGGGMRYARRERCEDGYLEIDWGARLPSWRWRFHRCPVCGVLVLPQVVEYLDLRFWGWKVRSWVRDVRWKVESTRKGES